MKAQWPQSTKILRKTENFRSKYHLLISQNHLTYSYKQVRSTNSLARWQQLASLLCNRLGGRSASLQVVLHLKTMVYFTLPPLFQRIPTDFHRTQPIPTDPVDSPLDFQRNPTDLTKFRCESGPSLVKVQ